MAGTREKGNLISCLMKTLHHVSPGHTRILESMIEAHDDDAAENIVGYYNLIRDELATVMMQLEKIKKVADEKGFKEITAILEAEVEFGHRT